MNGSARALALECSASLTTGCGVHGERGDYDRRELASDVSGIVARNDGRRVVSERYGQEYRKRAKLNPPCLIGESSSLDGDEFGSEFHPITTIAFRTIQSAVRLLQ